MSPAMQDAVGRLQALPDDAQEAIAPRLHDYLNRLEELRALVQEGIDSGPGEPLNIEAIMRRATGPDDVAPRSLGSGPRTLADDPIVADVRAAREALFAEAGDDLEEFGRQIRASEAAEGLTSEVWPPRPVDLTPRGGD